MSERPTHAAHLDPAGESEWARFRRHLDLAHGFWLTFLFAASAADVRVFEQRTKRILRNGARTQKVLAPRTPQELESAPLEILQRKRSDALGCIWVDAVYADPPGQDGEWARAWIAALLALNQSRQRLREQLRCGLIIAAPAWLKPRVREAAPDLWSIRTLVIELAGPTAIPSEGDQAIAAPDSGAEAVSARSPMLAGEGAPTDRSAIERLRRVYRLLSEQHIAEAVELGHDIVGRARARGQNDVLAAALVAVGRAERMSGDGASALDHLEEALELGVSDVRERVMLLHDIGYLSLNSGLLQRAADAMEQRVTLCRQRATDAPGEVQAQMELANSLLWLAVVHSRMGSLDSTVAACQEAADIVRSVLIADGGSADTLNTLALTLNNLGSARRNRGEAAAASASYQEAVEVARRAIAAHGETQQTLATLALTLNNVGSARHDRGELPAPAPS